ncbi:MAG: pyruvate formate lyase family protein [Thermodesulfobacteriota bacterium]
MKSAHPVKSRLATTTGVMLFLGSLKVFAAAFTFSKRLNREIRNPDTGDVFNAGIRFETRDGSFKAGVVFDNGRVRAGRGPIPDADVTVFYKDRETLARIFAKSPEEALDHLLTNEMAYTGNMAVLTRFSYLTTLLSPAKKKRLPAPALFSAETGPKRQQLKNEILGKKTDQVRFLTDAYLGAYAIGDFPRIQYLRDRRFSLMPAVCAERAALLTRFHRENGFETDTGGRAWDPELRQAEAMRYVMTRKKPLIWDRHLLPGSTTAKEVGVPVYPEFIGTTIWPELSSIETRALNPNRLSEDEANVLNAYVFPYWIHRNVREYCRTTFGNPLSQRLEERFVLYFMMKNNAVSHTIPDFDAVLNQGIKAMQDKAAGKESRAETEDQVNFYRALQIALDGVLAYAENLGREAERQARDQDGERRRELLEMARVCRKVPAAPAETLYEAIVSLWISFVCLHVENANSALSIGRLDRLLQPFFVRDMEAAKTDEEREQVVRRAIELVASLFVKLNDHDPLIPSVGNKLFGGSSSDDTVTVGGVDENGQTAVCDMTYIILKAAEMLGFQDPNLNARYFPGVNSGEYLRRLCEVNVNMCASPIIHNDRLMIESLENQGFGKDAWNWGATGCVEPTLCGRHYGHTNCMLVNMVAPLEMALNNGVHPVMDERIGPATGDVRSDFPSFEDFLSAYRTQFLFLAELSVEINDMLGRAHQYVHPTPLLSAMFRGPLDKGLDLVRGGAEYNSSGVALVSITDVVDSLLVIKKLIYETGALDFARLMEALANDFNGPDDQQLLAHIRRVPKFGSGDPDAIALARDLMDMVYEFYQPKKNYRGGRYLPGYWSISYHVGFGMLSGALPSGRRKGQAFTPGLTPAPGASKDILANCRSVAALDHLKMPNNLAYNVKMVPGPDDPPARTLDLFAAYVEGYFASGGMQWQFNVVSTDVMRRAMERPEDFGWLLVRISGYNAYFVKLNRNMQEELINRTEFCPGHRAVSDSTKDSVLL